MTKFYLVRHAESEYNSKGIIQGQIDCSLSEKGREEAKKLARDLSDTEFDAIYSSDLKRSSETARAVADTLEMDFSKTENLRERDLGVLEGESISIWREVEKEDSAEWHPEDGESLREHMQRFEEFLDEVDSNYEKVLVFTHGGTIKAAMSWILNCNSYQMWRFRIDNCSTTRIKKTEKGCTIEEVNRTIL